VEVIHNYCLPLHAHNGDEKRKFINNKVMEAIVKKSVEKGFNFAYPYCPTNL
jgi:hypothetical protein